MHQGLCLEGLHNGHGGHGRVIEEIDKAGVRHTVKVVVGGAPVSRRYAELIGADGYASDAASAVKMIRGLLAG